MTHPHQEPLTPPPEPSATATAVGLGLTLTASNMETSDTETSDTVTARVDPAATQEVVTTDPTHHPEDIAPTETSSIESSRPHTAATFQRPTSLEHHHHLSPWDQSTAPSATGTASQPTSPCPTTSVPAIPRETETGKNTSTSMEPTMTSFTLPSRGRELQPEPTQDEQPVPQLSSPVHHERGSLHKRRMTVSPEKFNKGHFEPLKVRTDLPLPIFEPPAKRPRTATQEKKIEIYYDSVGTPKIKATPASIEAGFSPVTAVFSPDVTNRTPLPQPSHTAPSTSTVPSGHAIAALRLLHGAAGTPQSGQQPEKKPFRLLDAFVRNDILCMHLVSYLPMASLIDLYAISKFFHWKFNKEATAFVMASVRTWAPKADRIFPWRCYAPLCIKDPVKRQKSSAVTARGGPDADADYDQLAHGSRDVPSLRWLQMVVYRNVVATDMIISLASRGLLLPPKTINSILRMWFIMDLPLNAHRMALIRSQTYITQEVLQNATEFFLKVDMAFTDPGYNLVHADINNPARRFVGYVGCTLRQLLISERSMTTLWRVLKGWSPYPGRDAEFNRAPLNHRTDMMQVFFRHKGQVPPDAPPEETYSEALRKLMPPLPVAGFERVNYPEDDKTLTREERAKAIAKLPPKDQRYIPRRLLTPVDLIMKECVRRELKQTGWFLPMMVDRFGPRGYRRAAQYKEEYLYDLMCRDYSPAERRRIEQANQADEEMMKQTKEIEESLKVADDMEEGGEEGEVEEDFPDPKDNPPDTEEGMAAGLMEGDKIPELQDAMEE